MAKADLRNFTNSINMTNSTNSTVKSRMLLEIT